MPYTGELRGFGLAKESIIGTAVLPPTRYPGYIPPETVQPSIGIIESKMVRTIPDIVVKTTQGKAKVGGKLKVEVEPDNIGEILQGAFGLDTLTEVASFVVTSGVNDKIDFKENGGSQLHATIAAGTYIMGTSSATNLTLCKAVKTALEAAAGATLTYTVTYSDTTKKMTITASSTTVQILWLTGTNQATAAYALLGWSHADTSAAIAVTSDSTTGTPAFQHAYVRQAVSQLPTYTLWVDEGATQSAFAGCMVNKIDLAIKPGELVTMDVDWAGLSYAADSGRTESYSALGPFSFATAVIKIGGSTISDFDDFKFSIDNMVKTDHVINASIYPGKIYSEGFRVSCSFDMFVESGNISQWLTNFLTGAVTSLQVILTHPTKINGNVAHSLTITVPVIKYKTAKFDNVMGAMKISFAATAQYDLGVTNETMDVALVNDIATQY